MENQSPEIITSVESSLDREIFNKKLGERIRVYRRGANLSMKKISEQLEITFQQYQKYETGRNNITVWRLNQIMKVLNIKSLDYILDFDKGILSNTGN
jgi:transcriptional regulator with XRE-family HTH domain